jgi:hypothetical protein
MRSAEIDLYPADPAGQDVVQEGHDSSVDEPADGPQDNAQDSEGRTPPKARKG